MQYVHVPLTINKTELVNSAKCNDSNTCTSMRIWRSHLFGLLCSRWIIQFFLEAFKCRKFQAKFVFHKHSLCTELSHNLFYFIYKIHFNVFQCFSITKRSFISSSNKMCNNSKRNVFLMQSLIMTLAQRAWINYQINTFWNLIMENTHVIVV